VNAEEDRCMLMSFYQKVGQIYGIKRANWSLEVVAMLKSLGTALTYQNCMHEKNKSRLNSENIFATIRFTVFCLSACCL
jgi:hypothetical protein